MSYQDAVNSLALPPESLRHRVHGAGDTESFLKVGQRCSQDIEAALKRIGKPLESFESILDFGCGCGRVLRWLVEYATATDFYGTDIDPEAIDWCTANLPFMSFNVNDGLPPSKYSSQSFDLVYAISVFSHLNERYQYYWLEELRRITKPGGIVLISVHGDYCLNNLPADAQIAIEKDKIAFLESREQQSVFPEWYQTTFQTKEFVYAQYTHYFNVLDYIPQGMNDIQDMIILQKRDSDQIIANKRSLEVTENYIQQLNARNSFLEETIKTKNEHIAYLEALIKKIGDGRIMRILRAFSRS